MSKFINVQKSNIYTPFWEVVYATLGEPRFFNGGPQNIEDRGSYNISFRVNEEDPDVQNWISALESDAEELVEQYLNESGLRRKNVDIPNTLIRHKEEEDENGDPTGMTLIRVGAKARGYSKKKNECWDTPIPVVDAKGTPIEERGVLDTIGGGTIARACFDLKAYKFGNKVGVSIHLEAVQIQELVARGGGNAARKDAFKGMETEGFEYSPEPATSPVSDDTSEFEG